MKRLGLIFLLFFAGTAWAVSPSASQTCQQTVTATTTCGGASGTVVGTMTIGSGDVVVVYITYGATTMTTASVTDACGNTYTHQTAASGTFSTNAVVDTWTTDGTSTTSHNGTCAITVTRNAGSTKTNWLAEDYSGVGAIGNVGFVSHTTAATYTGSLATQDNNNFIVAGIALANTSNTTAASSGTVRASLNNSNGPVLVLQDNTSGSPASVTNAGTLSPSTQYVVGMVELRASGSLGRNALSSDSNLFVRMNCASACNYTLPSTPPSSGTGGANWNTTVVGYGNQVYQIVVQGPATLNGGSASITVPEYQAVKIWQDGTNYYATFLPLSAGTGLTVSSAATGITVAEDRSKIHTFANTVRITADSASITATTAGTATTIFTFPTLSANTNYSFVCSGTTTQATAGAGIGIAITAGTNAATNLEAHAVVATSATAIAAASSGNIANTTATAIYTGSTGTITTQLPWRIEGTVEVGASVPTLTIGFFTANASDAVLVKRGSFCSIQP